MINLLRVTLFCCGFIIGMYQGGGDRNASFEPDSQTLLDQQVEQISRDTLTWEDRRF